MRRQHLSLFVIGGGIALVASLLVLETGHRIHAADKRVEALQPPREVPSNDLRLPNDLSEGAGVAALTPLADETTAQERVPAKIDASARQVPPAQTPEQKYAGASFEQILVAESDLKGQVDVERERIGKELLDKNRLTLVTRESQAAEDPRGSARADGGFSSCVCRIDERGAWKATITREEFPEFKAKEAEWWWLACKVHDLKKSRASTGG